MHTCEFRQCLKHTVVSRLKEYDIRYVTLNDLIYGFSVYVPQLLQCLQNQSKLLVLSKTDGKHRLESRNTMSFGLKVTKLIQHVPCFIQRFLIFFCKIRTFEFNVYHLLKQNKNKLVGKAGFAPPKSPK